MPAIPPSWAQPPVLQGGQLRLEWTGGTLQTTTNVAGPWNDVPGAVSPHLQPTTNPDPDTLHYVQLFY